MTATSNMKKSTVLTDKQLAKSVEISD